MPTQYDRLAEFVHEHADDPVRAALIVNAWQWTSLLPEGPRPASVEEVPTALIANCGVRDWLFRELFKPLGIQHRRVNFYDVPIQGGHSTTELLLPTGAGSRWMWFDSTLGVYACIGTEHTPASIDAIFASWPNVTFWHCRLPGWQGSWIDPELADADTLYEVDNNQFFYYPEPYRPYPGDVSGERYSLYFGPNVYYYDGPTESDTPVYRPRWSWRTGDDESNQSRWKRLQTTYHDGRPVTQYGEYEEGEPYLFRFIDFCHNHIDSIEWYTQNSPHFICAKRIAHNNGTTINLGETDFGPGREIDPFLTGPWRNG